MPFPIVPAALGLTQLLGGILGRPRGIDMAAWERMFGPQALQALLVQVRLVVAFGGHETSVVAAADLLLRVQAFQDELTRGGHHSRRIAGLHTERGNVVQEPGHPRELRDELL